MVKLQIFLANSIFTPIFKILVRTLIARKKYILEVAQKHENRSVLDFLQEIARNITYF